MTIKGKEPFCSTFSLEKRRIVVEGDFSSELHFLGESLADSGKRYCPKI